ncbi:phosphoribosyl-ATP pyrophosphohydrolase [Rudaeicoccus suwonensis]|uniref:Phosphoribosyl-ATP pyrophosphohydrolase n=1 Tax=Rudaeicoccus suwonensis TaxID=657409 RepID=A0A561E753_9MICO|nr:phosphoribosyl-ATP pyrophosphohydrolase [Rudaeicoccus suwonensis]TWE11443.1 hypothetical protein BKA23_0210 [Rudaeicoccus suwonensis]
MDLTEWTSRLEIVSAGYAEVYAVNRSPEWLLLKLTEELGELSQAWLASSGQGRNRDKTPEQLESAVAAECADVVAMALLFARNVGVDIGQALTDKWLPWEDYHRQRHDSGTAVPPVPLDANARL